MLHYSQRKDLVLNSPLWLLIDCVHVMFFGH